MTNSNKDIEYGNIEFPEATDENTKVKISMWIGLDLKKKLKKEAELKGVKYQALMRNIIENHFKSKSQDPLEALIENLVQASELKTDNYFKFMELVGKALNNKKSKAVHKKKQA